MCPQCRVLFVRCPDEAAARRVPSLVGAGCRAARREWAAPFCHLYHHKHIRKKIRVLEFSLNFETNTEYLLRQLKTLFKITLVLRFLFFLSSSVIQTRENFSLMSMACMYPLDLDQCAWGKRPIDWDATKGDVRVKKGTKIINVSSVRNHFPNHIISSDM